MSSASIRNQISSTQSRLGNCQQQLAELQKKLEKLKCALRDWNGLCQRHHSDFRGNSNTKKILSLSTQQVKVLTKYQGRLESIYNGPKERTCTNGMQGQKNKILRMISQTEHEIEQLRREMASMQSRITSLSRDLDRAMSEEAKRA